MNLINFPPVRVQKYPQGYTVEIQRKTWYGKKYWIHIIGYSGMPDEPYYYSDFNKAVEAGRKYFYWDLLRTNPNVK